MVDFFKRLCEYAVARRPEAPLAFTIEPVDREVQLKGLIGPTEEAVKVVAAVRRVWPNLGLTLDMAHVPQVGETLEQAVAIGKDFLDHAHPANTVLQAGHPRYGDTHPQFGVDGGQFDLPDVVRFLRALKTAGFFKPQTYGPRPIVSAEIRPGPGETPTAVDAETRRKLLDAFVSVDWDS